jgi:uncharacterized protein YndB with AHSA1/START domain
MRTWTAFATASAPPEGVLATLTDPDACARWAPLPFEVEDDLRRLQTGTRTRVSGKLAGRRIGFDIEVHEARDGALRLSAEGPVSMDVDYRVAPHEGGSRVEASVSVHPGRGLIGSLVAGAAAGLLEAGALSNAVNRIAREAALV